MPVNAIVMPYLLQTSITLSSRIEPPGCAMYCTPLLCALSMLSPDIRGKKRNANVSAARQMTMYIIREVTGMSMEAIGQEFQRDHSTVVYSIKTMEENIKRDQHLKEMCSDIMKNVRT